MNSQSRRTRGNIGLVVAICAGLLLGIVIKKVHIGLLIGLVIGLLSSVLLRRR